jgi:hypothetical protein
MNDLAISLAMCVVLFFLGVMFTICGAVVPMREEAVERGFAEWVVHPDGSTTWKWKEQSK